MNIISNIIFFIEPNFDCNVLIMLLKLRKHSILGEISRQRMGTHDPRGRFYMQSKVNFRRRVAINPSHEEFHYTCSWIQESSGLTIFLMSKRRYLIFRFIDQLADVTLCHLNCKIVQLLKSKFYTCTSEHLSNLISRHRSIIVCMIEQAHKQCSHNLHKKLKFTVNYYNIIIIKLERDIHLI